MEGNCIGESKNAVPDYSRGFFCSDDAAEGDQTFALDREPLGCDYTHNHKADCSTLGGSGSDEVCPMRIANIKSCSDKTNTPSLAGEIFSMNSRCFATGTPAAVCLESYCNSIDSKIDIVVDAKVYQCDYEGQELDLGEYIVQCPRLAIVCPHLVCPADCSGKGVCDYCLETPQCVCDDPFDDTPGCYGRSSGAGDQERDAKEVAAEKTKRLARIVQMQQDNARELQREKEELGKHKTKIEMLEMKLQKMKEKVQSKQHEENATIRKEG